MAKRDEDAPPKLIIKFFSEDGDSWGELIAMAKDFKTGSIGFYANGKVRNPKNKSAYQVGANIILIGSKGDE